MWKLVIAYLSVVWYAIFFIVGLLGWREARKRYFLRRNTPISHNATPMTDIEGVSIIRPLKGLDPNMYENLETTFTQIYPKFEIIFSVAEEDDPCLDVVQMLVDKYPQVDVKLSIGEEIVGVNPKINNMMTAFRIAKYDILWVIDSNVQVVPETLMRSVKSLTSKTGIGVVHHVPYALVSERDAALGTQLEQAFLNTNHAKMYIALNALAIDSCVMGKSNLYRRSHIEQISSSRVPLSKQNLLPPPRGPVRGLPAVAKYAAEDAKIGQAIWHELGLSHILDVDVAANALGPMSFKAYVERRARWIRVRKADVLAATILEPLTESVLAGILFSNALSCLSGGRISAIAVFAIHWCIVLSIDLDVRYCLASTPFSSWHECFTFILAWAGRELLAFPIWLYAIFGNEINWRGVKYRMLRNGEVERSSSWSRVGSPRSSQVAGSGHSSRTATEDQAPLLRPGHSL
ncbi:hypothetical protein FRC19_001846 [Serendipita sp. 401]|nr:hypothetical protein FRC19_001846 [Serendipita sp. 401]KAG8866321.1 hypothetical protein FRC20_008823 [Serendipita sp. 405]